MTTYLYIIMGVSGSGKSTIGQLLSERTGIPFFDADDFHPPANVAKMSAGQPLNDDDRRPWLEHLAQLLQEQEGREGAILACSALKDHYREVLGAGLTTSPRWVYLKGSPELILARMRARSDHYMPPELLDSQFAALEEPAGAQVISIELPPEAIISTILDER